MRHSGRRYCFSNQPHIGQWNLLQLANAIYPLVREVEPLREGLTTYNSLFLTGWYDMMAAKLGLKNFQAETDDVLIGELVEILQPVETDMTIFFRNLATIPSDTTLHKPEEQSAALCEAHYTPLEISDDYRRRPSD
jgi:serine/tyrosine/threonine adenylyltransferase